MTALLTGAVVLVNGWTDAPNAIATCVMSRALSPGRSVALAAAFNLLGVAVMTAAGGRVALTVFSVADFGSSYEGSVALAAALFAIVLWAVAAWAFGIPTSESHALIAGLTGAAVALHGGFSGVDGGAWLKVVLGLAASLALGFAGGAAGGLGVRLLFRRADRAAARSFFSRGQVVAAAAMAFMHGAQDGQKFIAVFLLCGSLSGRGGGVTPGLLLLTAGLMAAGTSMGGFRIIRSVGRDMARVDLSSGFAADLSAALCLLAASLLGLPVSTTHTKTAAIMGVAAQRRLTAVNWRLAGEMAAAWVFTFPGCGLLGYVMARLFMPWF